MTEFWQQLTPLDSRDSDLKKYGELLSIYDDNGQLLGQASSNLAHKIGLWHQAFHAWIVGHTSDHNKFVILQQRGKIKRDFPNRLDISAAGHYKSGEGVEGGIRELQEELGIDVNPSDLILIAHRRINATLDNGIINREFQNIYALIRNPGLEQYRPGFPEVSGVFQCDLEELRQLVDGALTELICDAIIALPDGSFRSTKRIITPDDLIQSSRKYTAAVLACLSNLLDSGAVPGRPATQLPDGSTWRIG
jgi:isopentenyldiphosphate isomerase